MDLSVSLDAKCGMQKKQETNHGIFWPVQVYINIQKKRPDPADHPTVKRWINEKWEFGVILDESVHGFPAGATRLTTEYTTGAEKRAQLADSSTGMGMMDVDQAWDSSFKRQRVTTGVDTNRERGAVTLKLQKPKADQKLTVLRSFWMTFGALQV